MNNKDSSVRVVKFLFGLWRIAPVLCLTMILTQAISYILSTVIAPVFVSQLLSNIASGTANIDNSIPLLIWYSIILLAGNVIIFRVTIAMAFLFETKAQANVMMKTFKHLHAKSLNFHNNKMSGGIVSDNNKLSGSIERFWDMVAFTVTPIITTIVSVCITLSFIFWQYAVAIAILSIIIIAVIIRSQTKTIEISRQVAEKSSATTAYFADSISNIATVKAFAGSKNELTKYKSLIKDWRGSNMIEMKKVLIMTGIFSVMMTIMRVSAFIGAIVAIQYHMLNIGAIYLVLSYTISIVEQLWSVSNATRNYIRIIGDAGPMIKILDEPVELNDIHNPKKFVVSSSEIEFKNIRFTHKDSPSPLFDNFSLQIKPGEQIGLVGRSGSGKTSLTKLLLRFSDIEEGQILIDNQDISKIKQDDLHRAISYVSQEPILFHRSLRENIAYGKPNATIEEIKKAAKQAHALDFIESLPDGFDTLVGERGVKLSGGQRQRIAIARAILKDAPILILDEATSALDSESEKLIQDALNRLMKGRTSVVIAHRLSTIAKLDRIIVMDEGKIIENDKHENLLKQSGVYAKLWAHQSGGFIEE